MQLHKRRAMQARLARTGAAPVLTAPGGASVRTVAGKLEGMLQGVNRISGSGV